MCIRDSAFVAQMDLQDWVSADALHRLIDWTQAPDGELDEEMRAALGYYPPFAAWAGRDDLWAEVIWNNPWSGYWENSASILAIQPAPSYYQHNGRLLAHPSVKQAMRDINLDDYWRENGWPDHCQPLGEDDFVCE